MSRLRLLTIIFLAAVLIALSMAAYHGVAGYFAAPSSPPDLEQDPGKPVIVEPEKPAPFAPTVGLYTGRGSWDPDLEAMHNFLDEYALPSVEIDQETLNSADLGELCDILVFVGGYSSEYLHYVGNHGNIRIFVEEGGSFVGFCAGAYYASSTMVWGGKHHDYPLKLFTGEAVGPLNIGYGSLATLDLNRDIPFNRHFGETIGMRYFDGPSFTGLEETGAQVLAYYGATGEAAVIAFPLGEGRVLLSGPHPELGYIPEGEQIDTRGGGDAQWPWLYEALRWLSSESKV